ncbi:origin recognition complex subunit 6 isoform X2 [Ascaphus truei]|uniref:origin recognition complex subunit 6 isoform X2 n=1 Tax=Ascaphus truei TaxID=8439 RepID=UPI003F594E7A
MMDYETLKRLAPKLGITSSKVIGKAEEYLRLSQVKCTGLAARTTATSNTVMCLELAAGSLKHPVDKEYLIRLSGLNKKVYQSCLKSFECLLGVDSKLGVRDLAVQHGCMEAVNMASKILHRYETRLVEAQQGDLDLSKPLFTTAALYSACRCLKLKMEKNKLLAASGVKRAIFNRLCVQLEEIGSQICREGAEAARKPAKRQRTLLECIAQADKDRDVYLYRSIESTATKYKPARRPNDRMSPLGVTSRE